MNKELTPKEKLEFLNEHGMRYCAWDEDDNEIEVGISDEEINELYDEYLIYINAPSYDWKLLRDMSEEDKKKLPKHYNISVKGEEHEEFYNSFEEEE